MSKENKLEELEEILSFIIDIPWTKYINDKILAWHEKWNGKKLEEIKKLDREIDKDFREAAQMGEDRPLGQPKPTVSNVPVRREDIEKVLTSNLPF